MSRSAKVQTVSPGSSDNDETFIKCRLCGRSYRTINQAHLIFKHGWDSDHPVLEYRAKFGLRSSWCKDAHEKSRVSKKETYKRKGQWWDRARIKRELRSLHRKGHPLNNGSVQQIHGRLRTAALRRYGSWDAALIAAGFDPEAVRASRPPFDKSTVIKLIHELKTKGHSLNHRAVFITDSSLIHAARHFFGTWDAALLAAGVDSWRVRLTRHWTKDDVLREIRKLPGPISSTRAHREYRALAGWASHYFKSWIRALNAAGFEYRAHQVRVTWTKERILQLIADRRTAGKSLRPGIVHVDEGGILRGANREFGSWVKALRAANVPKNEIDIAMSRSRLMARNAALTT